MVTRPDCVPYGARKQWEQFWAGLRLGEAGRDEFGVNRVEDKNLLNMIKQVEEQRQLHKVGGINDEGEGRNNSAEKAVKDGEDSFHAFSSWIYECYPEVPKVGGESTFHFFLL